MTAPHDRWLDLLLAASILKTTPRTGWHQRGVPQPEDVAAHSWSTAMVALALAEMSDQTYDHGRLLSMAVLHDLAEAEVSDIPRQAGRYLPAGAKNEAEARALAAMLDGLPMQARWTDLMADYKNEASPEARLVRDADRLEFLLQAWIYRETTGNRRLDQVRRTFADHGFATVEARVLVDRILARWPDGPAS